jgi:hypothetical protein
MLQAHSFLWNYLWLSPNVLLLVLALLMYWRGLSHRYPVFTVFAVGAASAQLIVYTSDLVPAVSPATWWIIFWSGLMVEGLLKFALIAEIFNQVFGAYAALAKSGRIVIRGVGVFLIFAAAIAAALTPKDGLFGIVAGAHRLEETIYLIETGLLLFIFLFSSYFQIRPARQVFGIALGLAVSACVHLATWAVMASGGLPEKRNLLDLLNMATYHVCVLIWYYFLLIPEKARPTKPRSPRPPAEPPNGLAAEDHLNEWNRELERLLQ